MAKQRTSPSPPPAAGTLFTYKDARGYNRAITAGNPPLSQITEYIIDRADWAQHGPGRRKKTTVDDILGRGLAAAVPCGMCGSTSTSNKSCVANDCTGAFRSKIAAYGESITEIRSVPGMGKGIFATCSIPSGAWIGEYLGALVPSRLTAKTEGSLYLFDMSGDAPKGVTCDAAAVGNWTRFMNHHCRPNVQALDFVYARRRVTGFQTLRRIKKGEQLVFSYGDDYFPGNGLLCKCDALEGDHTPRDMSKSDTTTRGATGGDGQSTKKTRKGTGKKSAVVGPGGSKVRGSARVEKNTKEGKGDVLTKKKRARKSKNI